MNILGGRRGVMLCAQLSANLLRGGVRMSSSIPHLSLATPPVMATSAAEAMEKIEPGSNIFVHTAMMAPVPLLDGLTEHHKKFENNRVKLYHLHTEGEANYLKYPESFQSVAFFCGSNDRKAVNEGSASFVPVFLSEISLLWKEGGPVPLDYALLQVSPPDAHGYCSLGCSVDVSVSAMHHARHVIAMVNKNVPRTQGDGLVHVSRLNTLVEIDTPLPYATLATPSAEEVMVGKRVAELVPDGAALQMGIGRIPDSVLAALKDHSELSVHSEMFSDGVVDLMECGAITGRHKKRQPFQTVGSFCVGTKRMCDYINDNPFVKMMRTTYVNDPAIIKSIDNMHAINTCIEMDLTGQACADSIGHKIHSGVGGQMDFMRGAFLSMGGKAIMAMTSRTAKGVPRIVPLLQPGAGVTMTRNHMHWVVTEYGAVNLFGLTLEQRAAALTRIAHPDDRKALTDAHSNRFRARQ